MTHHLNLVASLSMRGAIPPFAVYVVTACSESYNLDLRK